MKVAPKLMAAGLVGKMGKQDNKLETSVCCFAKLGGHKLPQIKIWALATKPD